jgi:RecJ-like exonuclease
MSAMAKSPKDVANTDAVPEGTPGAGENVCRACNGTGKVSGQECRECGGSGKVLTPVGGAG